MREGEVAELLGVRPFRIRGLAERRIIQRYEDGVYRFTKSASGVESGTAIFTLPDRTEIIRGFPKIQRAMVLRPTIERYFEELVAVEEKMNGYNARIALVGDRLVGLTRGGIICPYTTYKAQEKINKKFFEDRPDLVICAEVVGPDNPYVPKFIYPEVDSLEFYVFDIREKNTGAPLTLEERLRLVEEHGLRPVGLFGIYPVEIAPDEIEKIIRGLGSQMREGVVVKDPLMRLPPVKYTSSQSNCADLQYAFRYYSDYGQPFLYSRIVREAFQSVEWEEGEAARRERYCRLGQSILEPMIGTIEERRGGDRIFEDVYMNVDDLGVVEEMRRHLKRVGVDAIFEEPIVVDGGYRVRIRRFHPSTTDKTEAVLQGQLW